jgi:hypothetical protein
MFQCEDCEFFERRESGEISLNCDPFSTVKGPECLSRWQLIKLNQLITYYQATLGYYEKFAPMQEKMFKAMEKEIESMNESEKWKTHDDADEDIDLDEHDLEDQWR